MSARVISMTEGKEVKVFGSIDDVGREPVDSMSQDGFFTYGYFKTLETSKPYNILLSYAAVYDANNVVAVAPCYVDLDDPFSGFEGKFPFAGSVAGLASRLGFCLNRLVVCYSPNSYHGKILVREGYDERTMLELVSKKIDDICKSQRILFSSFPFVSESEGVLEDNLCRLGYLSFPSARTLCLDVIWSDFEGYLESLSYKTRKDVRREIKLCKGSEVSIVEEKNFGGFSSTLSNLHSNLFSRYNPGGETPYGPSFFSGLSEYARDKTRVLIARKDGSIIGFSLSLQHQSTLDVYLVGFDYSSRTSTDFVYFNLAYYEPIRLAIAEGVKRIHFSINSEGLKLKRGCKVERTHSFVKCHNAFVGSLYASYMRRRKG